MHKTDLVPSAQGKQLNLWQRLSMYPSWRILVVLVVICLAFAIANPEAFATGRNLRSIATDASILILISVGMAFVIATAGIDLSVGAVLVFSGILAAKVMLEFGDGLGSILLGLLVAILSGLAWGLINGILITAARVPALIVTLGTMGMATGAGLLITNGTDLVGIPESLVSNFGVGRIGGVVPWVVVVAVVVAALGIVAMTMTRFGRHTLAIGSNPEAARRSGINVDRHLRRVYALQGMLAGFAGFVSLARFSTTTIAGHMTDNLQAITAVVLGGTSLFGGVASVFGSVVGAFFPIVLQNGFVIAGLQSFWQQVAIGGVLIVAVYLDQRRRNKDGGK